MPRIANKSEDSVVSEVTSTPSISEGLEEMESLRKQLAEMQKMVESLQKEKDDLVASSSAEVSTTDVMAELKSTFNYNYIPAEVNPNKQIIVTSLCYGPLNLGTGGGKAILKFEKFGDSRPVLYSTLMNIVNHNRKFAEKGRFYISDRDAVYNLGLTEAYQKIATKDIVENILEQSSNVVDSIVSTINEQQRDVLIRKIVEKMYNGENVDMNKASIIEKKFGISFSEKIGEIKTIENNLNRQ